MPVILEGYTFEKMPLESSTQSNGYVMMSRSMGESTSHSLDPVSYKVKEIFQIVVFVSICGFISLFGIGANVVNMIIFVRQGFKDSINISLLGLAVADLGCAATMFWMSVGFNPLIAYSDLNFNPFDVVYLSGGWPHAFFNRVTSFITTFITVERCLCITIPLKVKDIITPLRTKIIILSIFLGMFILFTPFYFVNKLEMVYDQSRNKTIFTLVYTESRVIVETVTFPIHSVAMPAISLMAVLFSTLVLIAELNKKQKWRQTSIAKTASKPEMTSVKEKKVVKMVLLISLIFIACYTPATVNFFLMTYNPDFSFTGKYANVFFVVWSFTALVQTISFSVNIFVYFSMSSKFKVTLLQIVGKH